VSRSSDDTGGVTAPSRFGGMALAEVFAVLDAVERIGCRYWLEGGWGVDALVGHQSRPHRDLDVDIDARLEQQVLAVLAGLGYVLETDWRPNRVELVAPGRGWVDVHPLALEADGSARQVAPGGGTYEFPSRYFTTGTLAGRPVPCVTIEAQRLFRSGYQLRPEDRHDLARLDALEREGPRMADAPAGRDRLPDSPTHREDTMTTQPGGGPALPAAAAAAGIIKGSQDDTSTDDGEPVGSADAEADARASGATDDDDLPGDGRGLVDAEGAAGSESDDGEPVGSADAEADRARSTGEDDTP
jgi:lincosamide nucleotidyltransferase A/C/D/E